MSTLHPAFAMRGMPQAWTGIYTALGRAKRWSQSPVGPTRNWKFILDPTPEELKAYLDTRHVWKEMAVDVETPRDNPTHITICGIGIEPFTAILFPWREPFISIARPALQDPTVVKSGHNFGYDELAFMAYECDVAWPIWNTIEAESLLNPPYKEAKKRRWLSLKPTCLVRYYDGVPFFGSHNNNIGAAEDPITRAFFRVAFPDVPDWLHERLYCGMDVIWTRLLRIAQRKALIKAGMLNVMLKYVAPAHPTIVRMERRGLPVDEKRRGEMLRYYEAMTKRRHLEISAYTTERFTTRLEQLRLSSKDAVPCADHPRYTGKTKSKRKVPCEGCARLYEGTAGLRKLKTLGDSFKDTSDDHWRWLLFAPAVEGGLGLRPLSFTEVKKLPQVDDETIETLQRQNPEITILAARVDLLKMLHSLGVIRVPVDTNGRAHFALSQHRTTTQRMASGKDDEEEGKQRGGEAGNIQNKKDAERSIFCAGTDDFVLFEWDWSQIELEVMAWQARDMPLIRDLRAGICVHSQNAAAMFDCGDAKAEASTFLVPFEGKMCSARQAGKKFTHRANYGGMDRNAGRMYHPCSKWSLQQVVDFIIKRWSETDRAEGISPDTVRRLVRGGSVEHARLYEYANTLTAARWRRAYFAKRPGLLQYQNRIIAMVERDGYLINPFGYKLKFWNFDYSSGRKVLKDKEEALASGPQGTVAFMSKVLLRHEGELDSLVTAYGGELWIQNHDAFIGRIPKAMLEEFYVDSKKLMEREWPELGTIPEFGLFRSRAEFMIGWNWGKMHKHKEECGTPILPQFPWGARDRCDKIENSGGLVEWEKPVDGSARTQSGSR